MCVTRGLFNSNNFTTSAALVEVCALLSVSLVMTVVLLNGEGYTIGPVSRVYLCVCVYTILQTVADGCG